MSLGELQGELVAYLAEFLDPQSAGRLAATCRHLHKYTTGDQHVKMLMQSRLGAEKCALRGWAKALAYTFRRMRPSELAEMVQSRWVLSAICEPNNTAVVRILLEDGVFVHPWTIELVAGRGDADTVKLLLAHTQDHVVEGLIGLEGLRELAAENQFSKVPVTHLLGKVAELGHAEVLKVLLADPRAEVPGLNWEVRAAARNGHAKAMRVLLADPRANITDLNRTLEMAARAGHAEVLGVVLADPRAEVYELNQEVGVAAQNGHVEVMKVLLADPRANIADLQGAFGMAARAGHAAVVELLLTDERVDPTAFDNAPIQEAARGGHAHVLELLLADTRVRPGPLAIQAISEE